MYGNSKKSPLGVVVGAMLKADRELSADPISQHYGFYPDTDPAMRRIAAEHGWTPVEIAAELGRRQISSRWIYFAGVGAVLPETSDRNLASDIQEDR